MFGDRLKVARKNKNYTLDELSIAYNNIYNGGLNKGTLSKYENNKQEPMITVVNNLSKILDVSIDFLLNDTTAPATNQISTNKKNIFLLSTDEQALIKKYRPLDENGRSTVNGLVDMLYKQQHCTTVLMVARGGNRTNTFLTSDLDDLLVDKPDEYDDI